MADRGLQGSLEVKGYREFIRATNRAEKESKRFVRDSFRQVGEVVRIPAADDLRDLQPTGKSAAGLRTVVRTRGVDVEQSLRKVTGKRPDWGKTQMRKILIPNLESHEREIERKMEEKLDDIADHFENN
ncbi:MAG TPA: hypothetical protein VLA89_05250 [Gemmatimonadales bacterium]|nr:hypothetical protein [Gemmatimonadales bacterium]